MRFLEDGLEVREVSEDELVGGPLRVVGERSLRMLGKGRGEYSVQEEEAHGEVGRRSVRGAREGSLKSSPRMVGRG